MPSLFLDIFARCTLLGWQFPTQPFKYVIWLSFSLPWFWWEIRHHLHPIPLLFSLDSFNIFPLNFAGNIPRHHCFHFYYFVGFFAFGCFWICKFVFYQIGETFYSYLFYWFFVPLSLLYFWDSFYMDIDIMDLILSYKSLKHCLFRLTEALLFFGLYFSVFILDSFYYHVFSFTDLFWCFLWSVSKPNQLIFHLR